MAGINTLARLQIALGIDSSTIPAAAQAVKDEFAGIRDGIAGTGQIIAEDVGGAFDRAQVSAVNAANSISTAIHQVNDDIGNAGDTIRVGFLNTLDQAQVDTTNFAENVGAKVSSSIGHFGDVLESGRSKIREFGRAGSELSIVAAALGPEFEQALGPVGQFIHVAGDAGLVASAIADLGPSLISTTASILGLGTAAETASPEVAGLGTAAATATPEVAGLGAAADTAAVGGVGVLAGSLTALLAPLGLAAGAAAAGQLVLNKLKDASVDAQIAGSNLSAEQKQQALDAYNNQKAAQGLTQALFEQRQGVDESARGFALITERYDEAKSAADTLTAAANETGAGLDNVAARAIAAGEAASTLASDAAAAAEQSKILGIGVQLTDGYFSQFTTDAGETGAALDNIAGRAIAAANGFDTLATAINSVPTLGVKADNGPGAAGSHPGAGAGVPPPVVPPVIHATNAAANTAIRDQSAAWQQAARDAETATNDMFAKLKSSADAYFAVLHNRRLADLRDQQAAADAAIQKQEDVNNAALDALGKQISAKQAAERLESLQNAVTAAQAAVTTNPGDQSALDQLRQAKQALSDFQDQQQYDSLKAQTDTANAALEAQKKSQDDQFASQVAAEDKAYQQQLTSFNNALDALKTALAKHPEEWAKTQGQILALLAKNGADYETAGANLGDKFATGLQSEVNKLIADAKTWSDDLLKAAGLTRLATGGSTHTTPHFAAGLPTAFDSSAAALAVGQSLAAGPTINLNVTGQVDGQTLLTIVEKELSLSSSRQTAGTGAFR